MLGDIVGNIKNNYGEVKMGFLSDLFGLSISKSDVNNQQPNIQSSYNEEYINKKILEFKSKFDLNSVTGIMSIPIQEEKNYINGPYTIASCMPEQILNKLATEYKKNGKYDLAIACLRKANELYPHSYFMYSRDDYERVVYMLIEAKLFKEAKEEHHRLDEMLGTRLKELQNLQNYASNHGWESKESYKKRIIDPYVEESRDRESYYWLLENNPDKAPKSFNAFRRMKRTNSKTYLAIKEEIAKKGIDIEQIRFWY